MAAMVNSDVASAATVARIYENRVAVELFFSAPHHSVIGLRLGQYGVEPVLDAGRGNANDLPAIAKEVAQGIEAFAEHYGALHKRLGLQSSPVQTASPLIEYVTEEPERIRQLLAQVKSFDAWGSSRNPGVGS
jgi:hypothetical protein